MNDGATNGVDCKVMGVRHSCLRYVGGHTLLACIVFKRSKCQRLSVDSSGNPRQPVETSAGVTCRRLQGRSQCLLPAPVATTRHGECLLRHESVPKTVHRLCERSVPFLQRLCRHGVVSTFRKTTGNGLC